MAPSKTIPDRPNRTPRPDWLHKAERLDALDRVSDAVRDRLRRWTAGTAVERMLGGAWLGHPVHPLAVQVPLGLLLSAGLLDLSGQPGAAQRLIGVGLLAVPPAAGAIDWSTLTARQRRVGLFHAALNTLGPGVSLPPIGPGLPGG